MFECLIVALYVVGSLGVGRLATSSATVGRRIRTFSIGFVVTAAFAEWVVADQALRPEQVDIAVAAEIALAMIVVATVVGTYLVTPCADGLRRRRHGEALGALSMLFRATTPVVLAVLSILTFGLASVVGARLDRGFGFDTWSRHVRAVECVAIGTIGFTYTFVIYT